MGDQIIQSIVSGNFGRVILVYLNAVSFTVQRVEVLNLVPCPLFYKDRSEEVLGPEAQKRNVILESPPEQVIEYLATRWLTKRLIEIFESAKLAEFGARTMHLEESYQTLSKLNKSLKLEFFKACREKIDQSLRETFTAQLICK